MRIKISIHRLILLILFINGILFTVESTFGVKIGYKLLFLVISLLLSAYVIYFKKPHHQISAIIGLSLLGNEFFFIALPLIFLPKILTKFFGRKNDLILEKLQFNVIVFLLYSLLLMVFTYALDFSFFNIFFWALTFASLLVIFVYYLGFSFQEEDVQNIFRFFKWLIMSQVIIALLQSLIHQNFRPGDYWTGSSGNSVVMGFYLFIGLFYFFVRGFVKVNYKDAFVALFTIRNILIFLGGAIILYLNDSKILILCFLIVVPFYSLLYQILKFFNTHKKAFFDKIIFVFILLCIALPTLYWGADVYTKVAYGNDRQLKTVVGEYANPELGGPGANGKFLLYKRTFIDIVNDSFWSWTFGVGPGKFGSKASNMMAYDILYKHENQTRLPDFIKPYSAQLTKRYMGDLWTKEIVERNKYRSATLAMPYAGIITLKGEYGFVGLLGFIGVIYSMGYYLIRRTFILKNTEVKRWALVISVFWISLPLHMIFDNFQEKSDIMLPMFLLTAIIYSMSKITDE